MSANSQPSTMETMTITVGDFKLILPSSARVPGVNVRADAIELDFSAFTGKLVIGLPGASSKDGRSQSLESAPNSTSPNRAAPPISSNNHRSYDDHSIRTPLPVSPSRQSFPEFLPDSTPTLGYGMSQQQFEIDIAAGLKRPPPSQNMPSTPMWMGCTQSAGLSQQIEDAALRGTQRPPMTFAERQNSEVSLAEDTSCPVQPTQVADCALPAQMVFSQKGKLQKKPKEENANEPDEHNPSQKLDENAVRTAKKKKRQRKNKHAPGAKRKRVSPAKTPMPKEPNTEENPCLSQEASQAPMKKEAAPESPTKAMLPASPMNDSVPGSPIAKDLPTSPVEKSMPSSPSEAVPAAVSNVVSDGKRVRFHAAEASSPTSSTDCRPITTPAVGEKPWTAYPAVAEDEGAEPARRWGATLTRIDEESALLLGGESEQCGFFKDMTHLDLHGKAWNRSRDTPDMIGGGRAWHTTTLVGNCLLVFGGEVERDGKREQTNDCIFYDTSYFSWYKGQIAGTAPSPRSGHAAALLPGSKDLVLFGGINGKRWLSDLHRLSDLAHWTAVKTSSKRQKPSARSYASLTTLTDFVVLFGGNNKSQSFNDVHLLTADLNWVFPIVEGRAPKPRTGHSAVATEDGKSVIVYGGWDDLGERRLFYSDVWKLTVISSTNCEWKCIYSGDEKSKTPGPRAGGSLCASIGKKAYLFGGWHQISYFNDVLELNTDC